MILTAGPSITQKEINYVTDAVTNGIDEHWNDYIKRFEKAFAEYIGVKYALTTSSCTGALHLALVACGIKEGDEVIVPDLSWIASASVICYTGGKPVFADVKPDSWCISPQVLESRITNKTKAIIPVHLYGQPAEMDMIMLIAEKYGLKVIEDAAPSVGATFQGKHTGSFGDIGCFSFQGAKMVATGEGGMLVTDDSELFERVNHFAEHGRSAYPSFEISDIGYKYKMSNLQAALGLAQLERVDELIAKKKLIFDWYCEELKHTEGISLNRCNVPFEESIYWMTSIVLNEDYDFGISRDGLMKKLKEKNIDTRPFFPLMSTFPMFNNVKYNHPVAEHLSENGINLPSGHRITHEQVIYVCDCIKEILWEYE